MTISTDLFELKDVIQKSREALYKVEEWAIAGLLTDEKYYKQYCLEQILIAIGLDLDELRTRLNEDNCDWESGILPK